MSKNMWFKVALALAGVVIAVFWLLSMFVDAFAFFTLAWAVAIFSGMAAVAYILRGIFSKKMGMMKKLDIFCGAGLGVVFVISLVFAIALPTKLVFPIIAIILTAAILISVLVVGGKKWDQGDNENVGYKTYRQRKEQEEKDKANKDEK